jgi:DNA polymerase-1
MSDSELKGRTLYLIDGSALVYRAYFAFIRNPLINSKGENTSAAFGFANSLLKLLREENPDYVAIIFDTPHPTFRHERYAEYKSTRAKMPEDLVEQLPRISQVVDALNIPRLELPGYEADDVIGTLARQGEKVGMNVWCVTGDKDFFQLVSDHVKIYYPRSGPQPGAELLGREQVKAKFGVHPEQVIDKLALMGDSSDNIPGIPGIGPRTADKLLEQFGSLEAVLDGVEQIKARGIQSKVADNMASARLSKELVTIATDVPVECELENLKRAPINYDAVKDLFLKLEFNRLLRELMPAEAGESVPEAPGRQDTHDYRRVKSLEELTDLMKQLSHSREVAIDTETTGLDAHTAELVGVSLSDKAGTGWYVPLAHTSDDDANLPFDEAVAVLRSLLENPDVQKIGQNIKYDLLVLRRAGIEVNPISFDTMLAAYVINPSDRQFSLDFLALKHFDHKMIPITDLIGKGKSQLSFATVPVDKAAKYAAEDADFTYRLRGVLAPRIDQLDMNNLYYNVELPLVRVLADMEQEGIRVDTDLLAQMSKDMDKKLIKVRKQIYGIAGGEFNINSTQQLSHILFEKLRLPTMGRTAKKTGYATDVRVLEELARIHELPRMILDYRQLTKLKNTYIDALPKLINPATGRVHTSFNQTIAATGRLSSTDPNLQNIPVRTEEGREIRRAFVPRDEAYSLLVADYSQIELRILTHISEDDGLIRAFKNREDIHSRTAAEVYGVNIDEVDSAMRRAAKTANFAIIYGVSAYGLSQQTDLDVQQAKQFIDTYFARYPGIKRYIDNTIEFAHSKGYVTTLLNRRRNLPEINDKNRNVRQFAERVAINTPIQGTAADMIKKAMIRIHQQMRGMKSRMLLQVHDELVFDAHRDETDRLRELVRSGMEKALVLRVPVVVDMGIGANWLEAK